MQKRLRPDCCFISDWIGSFERVKSQCPLYMSSINYQLLIYLNENLIVKFGSILKKLRLFFCRCPPVDRYQRAHAEEEGVVWRCIHFGGGWPRECGRLCPAFDHNSSTHCHGPRYLTTAPPSVYSVTQSEEGCDKTNPVPRGRCSAVLTP